MLPRLRKLAVSSFRVREFVQGIGGDGENDDGRANATDTDPESDLTDVTKETENEDGFARGDGGPLTTPPPKLHTLIVNEFKGALSEENLHQFLESYPYLRSLIVSHGGIDIRETRDQLCSEGITYEQDPAHHSGC